MSEHKWFSHDSNARRDPKVLAIRSKYGSEGYGWYWIILEMLREDNSFEFPLSKLHIMALTKELDTNIDLLNGFLNDCLEIGLFNVRHEGEQRVLFCEGLNRRMLTYQEKRKRRIEAGRKGGIATAQKSTALLQHCSSKETAKDSHLTTLHYTSNKTPLESENPTKDEVDKFVSNWNKFAAHHQLAQVKKLTVSRRKKLLKLLRDPYFTDNLNEIFEKAAASSFLMGENNRGWKMNFDFILRPETHVKILEDFYKGDKDGIAPEFRDYIEQPKHREAS